MGRQLAGEQQSAVPTASAATSRLATAKATGARMWMAALSPRSVAVSVAVARAVAPKLKAQSEGTKRRVIHGSMRSISSVWMMA